MSKSLAEIRGSASTSLPERTYRLCLAQALVAEVQSLTTEKANLEAEEPRRNDDEDGPKPRVGQGQNPRLAEIKARLEQIIGEMNEHTGELRLRATTAGEWRRWVDAHPARETGLDKRGVPILHPADADVAYGFANASDLLDNLGAYVVAWNGEPLQAGDWDFIMGKAAGGDLKELCRIVVQMHETSVAVPKLPSSSSTFPTIGSD